MPASTVAEQIRTLLPQTRTPGLKYGQHPEPHRNRLPGHIQAPLMPPDAAPKPQADADRLEAATDQAIAACGGNACDAVKALIVANEFLETEVCELMQAVSHAYARGRFKTYSG